MVLAPRNRIAFGGDALDYRHVWEYQRRYYGFPQAQSSFDAVGAPRGVTRPSLLVIKGAEEGG